MGAEPGDEGVLGAVERPIEGARGCREVGREGGTRDGHPPLVVERDPRGAVGGRAAEERRVGERRAGEAELGYERVLAVSRNAVERWVKRTTRGRVVGRARASGDVRPARFVDRNSAGLVVTRPAEQGRVE